MFNRILQVKIVKAEKVDPIKIEEGEAATFEGKMTIIGRQVERIFERAGSVVITYVLMDTIRQVMVERAKK